MFDGVGDGRGSLVACVGGAVANGGVVSSTELKSKLLRELENTEYIEFVFTVLLVFPSHLIASLDVLFALVVSMFVLRAN